MTSPVLSGFRTTNDPPFEQEALEVQGIHDMTWRALRALEGQSPAVQSNSVGPSFLRFGASPPEILAHIFLLSLPSISDTRNEPWDICLERSPWVLTHVSRRWRAVALASPALWCRIIIRSLAGTSPQEALQTLAQHSARWKILRITASQFMQLSSVRGRLPLLEHLSVWGRCEETDDDGSSPPPPEISHFANRSPTAIRRSRRRSGSHIVELPKLRQLQVSTEKYHQVIEKDGNWLSPTACCRNCPACSRRRGSASPNCISSRTVWWRRHSPGPRIQSRDLRALGAHAQNRLLGRDLIALLTPDGDPTPQRPGLLPKLETLVLRHSPRKYEEAIGNMIALRWSATPLRSVHAVEMHGVEIGPVLTDRLNRLEREGLNSRMLQNNYGDYKSPFQLD
ncbi:hypothetical protein B0H14DRAFT_2958956 [Mycena olivaceomarginata]|nr:hypothetical protein B0H14DRAFT_2958956 [Mycena olivaceomarginata]